MFTSRIAALAAGVLVATGLATGPAHAAPVLTDTVQIRNNIDSGTNGSWAWIDHRRSVAISLVSEGETGQPDTYSVVLTDVGTLRTIKGARSPQAGVTIPREVPGSFSGRYTFTVTSDTAPSTSGVRRWRDYRCQIGGACVGKVSSDDWPKEYFGEGATVTPNKDWRWEYRTCAERWVNSAAGNSGDITGKRCDRAVRADSPTVVQPECGAERGKVIVPSDRGVTYKVRSGDRPWRAVRAGEYPARPGVYWVRAEVRDGYRLVGQDRWRLTVNESEACPTPTPTPTDEPTVTPSPTVSPTTEPTEPPKEEPTEEPTEEPEPAPTVTETNTRVVVVNNIPVPSRVDTGLGGLAAK